MIQSCYVDWKKWFVSPVQNLVLEKTFTLNRNSLKQIIGTCTVLRFLIECYEASLYLVTFKSSNLQYLFLYKKNIYNQYKTVLDYLSIHIRYLYAFVCLQGLEK